MSSSLPWSAKTIKYLLFTFNLIFFIIGIILVSVGVSVKAYYSDYHTFLDDQYFSAPNLLIAIGVIIFIIAFFGCCGAIKENYCMVITFSTLLILIFVLQLAAGIAGYALKNQTYDFLSTKLKSTMENYNTDGGKEVTRMWDYMQSNFECCGVNSAKDWLGMNNTENQVPLSCCKIPPGTVNSFHCTETSDEVFKNGCLPTFGDYLRSHALTVGGVGIGFAFVQLVGIIFACHLSRQLRYHYNNV